MPSSTPSSTPSSPAVVTRFAPSPTGFLHLGGARTALFNWLYAKHRGGRFCLRIEDTDRARSTEEAITAILEGMKWLGLDWDGDPIFQSRNSDRHVAVAQQLLDAGMAYYCYASPEELEEMRAAARSEGRPMRYDGRWRDRPSNEAPPGVSPALRFRAPQSGETVIEDKVQGSVRLDNTQLDDMVLLRADGTPTYMLSVVVDDYDMGITHVIRGNDHLTNTFRQAQLYGALGWELPVFAHIPLIHGSDGAKLSKRHGAVGLESYRDEGFLPEAMRNYLLRLGWGHGDDEVISTEEAIAWFDFDGIGKSPSRFDRDKLLHLNAHYLRESDAAALVEAITPRITAALERPLSAAEKDRLARAMEGLKPRAETFCDLAANAAFYVSAPPLPMTEKAARLLDQEGRARLAAMTEHLAGLDDKAWTEARLEETVKGVAEAMDIKLGKIAQPMRAALTGSTMSPGLFEVMAILGREACMERLAAASVGKWQSYPHAEGP